jgi:hypothetical protein
MHIPLFLCYFIFIFNRNIYGNIEYNLDKNHATAVFGVVAVYSFSWQLYGNNSNIDSFQCCHRVALKITLSATFKNPLNAVPWNPGLA